MPSNQFYKTLIVYTTILLFGCCSVFSQTQLSQLQEALVKTTSATKKADICFTISGWYSDKLKIDSALFFANQIKVYSLQVNYETGIGKYHLALAMALVYRKRNSEAEENAVKAIEIFARQKENILLGRSYSQLATIEYISNNVSSARKNYWKAINYFVSGRDTSGSFKAYFWLARSYYKTSEMDSAVFYGVKALALAEQLNNADRVYQTSCLLAESFLSLGELAKAVKYFDYGLQHRQPTSDKVAIRLYLRDYATSLIMMHDFVQADSAIREFELMNVKLNDAYGKITLHKIKGIFAYEKKDFPLALNYLQQAYSKKDELRNFNSEIKDIVLLLGKTEYEIHNYDSAVIHLRLAAQISNEVRHLPDEMEANLLISKAFKEKGNADSSLFYFQHYALLKDSILSVQKQKTIVEVTTRYETDKKEQAIKILQKESEANSYLLLLRNQQIEKQYLEDVQKSQQFVLVSKQNEINKLDVFQKTLGLDIEKKENEKNQAKLNLMEKEAAYQKLLASKQSQQKKIAYAGIALILLSGGYGFYRYIRRKKIQNQQQVLNERLRISRELHDELGSTLSGIAMYSQLTKEQVKASKTDEVERSLNNMQHSAGEMVNKLNDIVWLVNPEKDSLQKLMERLEEYADGMALIKNIEVKINTPSKLNSINLPVESRRNIYLFCKEAINNAVKYSHAGLIELRINELDNKKIEFSISDNGNGFEAATIKKGNGLQNMQQRAADINGLFSLHSEPGMGTKISLVCKIT